MSQQTSEVVDRPQVIGWTFPRSDLAVHECLQELRIPPYEHFGEIPFVEVFRQHMYGFIGAGTLMIILLLVTFYVVVLNPAPWRPVLECRRAEAALRANVERFERIASCSADWIWETDAEDGFTYSSSVVEQMLGYRADEIIGKIHFDLFTAAEKERLMALGQKGLGTGARIFRERFRMLTKDGRVLIQETTAEPIIDSRGQFAGYRGVSRDITNQVRFVHLRQ
jgi:PAS domain S-box-containing protein